LESLLLDPLLESSSLDPLLESPSLSPVNVLSLPSAVFVTLEFVNFLAYVAHLDTLPARSRSGVRRVICLLAQLLYVTYLH